MSSTSEGQIDVTKASTERMTCMEVWGGNQSTWSHFVVPGLDLWVYSLPVDGDEQGGDVYYVSSCASGRITRMLIGDVSGHGAEASPVSSRLRDIMRRNVNYIDQTRVVESLNEQFEQTSASGRFATAIISTYFSPTRRLTICSAGHPPPLVFRSTAQIWKPLTAGGVAKTRPVNMPIGITDDQDFLSTTLKLEPGDMFLAYTDALFEARDRDGNMLSAQGIADVANSISVETPGDLVTDLLQRIRELHPENLATDDTTVVLARANTEGVPLKNNLLAPIRLLRGLFR